MHRIRVAGLSLVSLVLLVFSSLSLPGCEESSDSSSGIVRDPDALILSGMRVLFTVEEAKMSYTREDDGWFHLTENQTELSFAMVQITETDQKDDQIKTSSQSQIDTDIPDRTVGEYDKMRLIREGDGKVFLQTRIRSAIDEVDELDFEMQNEVEFVQGDFFDYEAGKRVLFRLSDRGMETSAEETKIAMERQFTPMLRSLMLNQLKEQSRKEQWKISDDDLGRLAYAETTVELPDQPNTIYACDGKTISFHEDRPAATDIIVYLGITAENFKK